LGYFAVDLFRLLIVFALVSLLAAVFVKGLEETFDVFGIAGEVTFVAALHGIVLVYLLMTALLALFVDFGYFLPR
jgi:hypothetical protein